MNINNMRMHPELKKLYQKHLEETKEFVPKDLMEWFLGFYHLYDSGNHSLIGAAKLETALRKEMCPSIEYEEGLYPATGRAVDASWAGIQNSQEDISALLWFKSIYDATFPE